MSIIKHLSLVLSIFLMSACTKENRGSENEVENPKPNIELAKFEPQEGECLFFIGQDLGATGGFGAYNKGYCDSFDVPAGFTVYTNFSPGINSYGHINKGNDGLNEINNWGSGDVCAQMYIDEEKYANSVISIGLSMVEHENKVARGEHDELIIELGEWIKSLGTRPVFLRIGYEFDGWSWNNYNKEHYLASWERIHTKFTEMQIDNVAFVWQSKGYGSGQEVLEDWYPGDDIVDWCAYSYFGNPDDEMLVFARKHKKPVFIAEATPVSQKGNNYFDADLQKPEVAQRIWAEWFFPFIQLINENSDVIKAFAYINVDWPSQPMWSQNVTFKQVDSRIQESELVSENWLNEMSKNRYIKPNDNLWEHLYNSEK